jgi:hypothetical protein
MKTLITALVGQRKNVGVVAALLTAGAVAGWAMSATFATITAAVEDLPAFEISDMKKLPLEEFKRGLIGSYAVTGTDPSGEPYVGGGVLDIALAPSGGQFDQGPNRDLDDEHQSGWFPLRQVLAAQGPRFQRHRSLEEDLVRVGPEAGQAPRGQAALNSAALQIS